MFSGNNSFGKTAFSVLVITFIVMVSVKVLAVEFDSDDPGDGVTVPYAWIKLGTMATGKLDYDGKVSASHTYIDRQLTIFDGTAEADVTQNGYGFVKSRARNYYHNPIGTEEFGLPDHGGSLGMASQTYKPFTITSSTLADGQSVNCSTHVVYDGLIVLQEKKNGEWSAGQIDFLFEVADGTSGDDAVTCTNEEVCSFEGQLKIQDSYDGTTHTYTDVDDMAPEIVVNIDFPDDQAANYWKGDGALDLTIVEIDDNTNLDDFTVLQGSLDSIPQAIKDAITNNSYDAAGNKIYYVLFDKTTTFEGEVGKKYYVYMDAHAAAQTSKGDVGDETLVVCDFQNTVAYDLAMSGANGQTTSTVSDNDAFGNSGTGGIDLYGGIVQWDDDVSLDYDFVLGDGTTSVMDTQANTGTITGDISGTGAMKKEGTGTLTLSTANTYTGATTVSEGGLVVSNTLASPVTVSSGAWLGGTGTFNAAVTNNGTLKPGDSIGTLTLGAVDYVQVSGGQLEIEVANTNNQSDKIVVGGDVDLDGTLYVKQTEKITGTKTYADIVSAGTLSDGTFDTVTGDKRLLYDYSTAVDGTTVDLTATKSGSFIDYAGSNTGGVAAVLDSTLNANTATGQIATVINTIASMSSGTEAQQAYSELTPANIANTTSTTAINSSHLFSGAIQGHISKARTVNNTAIAGLNKPERLLASNSDDAMAYIIRHRDYDTPAQGFVKTYGSTGDRESDGSQAGYDFEIYGTALGIDKLIDENLLAGTAFGYSNGNVSSSDNLTQNDMETLSTSIYGSWFNFDSYIDVVVGYGHNWYDVSRRINHAGLRATSKPESDVWSTSVTAGKAFYLADTTIEPFAGFSYALLKSRGFTESGAGNVSLSVEKNDVDTINSILGIRIAKYIVIKEKPLATEFTLAWKHDYSDRVQTNSRFVGSNSAFSTKGLDVLRDTAIMAVDVEANVSKNSRLFVKYDTEFNGQFQSHTGQIGIKVTF